MYKKGDQSWATISNNSRWNVRAHDGNICPKANRTLSFLRRNLNSCPQSTKEVEYKGLVGQVLEYDSSVWDSQRLVFQEDFEKAAGVVTRNYNYETGSMTGILAKLNWESRKKSTGVSTFIFLYKGLKDTTSIPTNVLISTSRLCRNHYSLVFHSPWYLALLGSFFFYKYLRYESRSLKENLC